MPEFDPTTKRLPVTNGWPVFLPTRPPGFSVRYDLNELFNIDMYCLSIDVIFIGFTARIVNFLCSAAVFTAGIDSFYSPYHHFQDAS